MMRRLVDRHKGILPLDTAESIWRVIIATFTYVQAPFSVHADLSAGDAAMRDSARFHFGFTVPFVPHMGAAERGRGGVRLQGRSRSGAGLRRRRRRLVECARSRCRAEDHRPAALRRARRPSGRRCRCSWFARGGRCAWSKRSRCGACGSRAGAWRRRRRSARLAEVVAVPGSRFRRRGAARLGSAGRRIDQGHRGAGQGRRLGARHGPRRQPRDPL